MSTDWFCDWDVCRLAKQFSSFEQVFGNLFMIAQKPLLRLKPLTTQLSKNCCRKPFPTRRHMEPVMCNIYCINCRMRIRKHYPIRSWHVVPYNMRRCSLAAHLSDADQIDPDVLVWGALMYKSAHLEVILHLFHHLFRFEGRSSALSMRPSKRSMTAAAARSPARSPADRRLRAPNSGLASPAGREPQSVCWETQKASKRECALPFAFQVMNKPLKGESNPKQVSSTSKTHCLVPRY